MREKIITLPLILLLTSPLLASEATILRVSKTINSKNVLHYKVKFDAETCELKSNVYAEWKMDEEDGRWKPLTDSMGMIRAPLEPKMVAKTAYEAEFVTDSMTDFRDKKILTSDRVRVQIEQGGDSSCVLKNEVDVQGSLLNIEKIHSKVTIFGNVKWVQIMGVDSTGSKYDKKFKD
ncbi:MAG: hypothetical protein NXH75_08875 [Halobacteriovoraceae bacterium]|nr:hypothetical protein [Halobacteriovoraceae bacterium]